MEISTLRNFAEQLGMDQWQTTSFDEQLNDDLPSMATATFCDNYYDMQLSSSSHPLMFNQEEENLSENEAIIIRPPFDELNDLSSMATGAFFNDYYDDMQLSSCSSHPIMLNQEEENLSENEAIIIRPPFKQKKTNSWEWDSTTTTSPSSPQFHVMNSHNNYPIPINDFSLMKPKEEIDFSYGSGSVSVTMKNLNLPLDLDSPTSVSNQNYVFNSFLGTETGNKRTNSKTANGHIIAERKRREKLNQKFIALSALVPRLKKMDKATVLEDAIKYLKQLQEKVNNLEDQTKKLQTMESVKKHEVLVPDSDINGGNLSSNDVTKPLAEIEARFSGKDVLVRIHCEKRKRILEKIVAEIEKLPLSVISSNVMTFGTSVLDITIIAQMEDGFIIPIKDFVKNLSFTLQRLMANAHSSTSNNNHSP